MVIDPKYFDYAASSPVWSEALEVFTEIAQNQYANPSSNHLYGKNARIKLRDVDDRRKNYVYPQKDYFLLKIHN